MVTINVWIHKGKKLYKVVDKVPDTCQLKKKVYANKMRSRVLISCQQKFWDDNFA